MVLHSLLHSRFQEVFGPPDHDLWDSEQWSLTDASGTGTVNVLLNGTRQGPLVWMFYSQDDRSVAEHFAVTREEQIDQLIEQLGQRVAAVQELATSARAAGPPQRRPGRPDAAAITDQLANRPTRPRDYAAENDALITLAGSMAGTPQAILQLTVDTILRLCRADSASLSILETRGGAEVFRRRAVVGVMASQADDIMPRQSPSGAVCDRDALLLFRRSELMDAPGWCVDPPISEAIIAPFHGRGRPIGTLCAIMHDPDRRFCREDARLLASVAKFAAAAFEVTATLDTAQDEHAEMAGQSHLLEQLVDQRTAELATVSHQLRLAERMAAMGTLSAGLGHDVGNMAFAMRSKLEELRAGAKTSLEHIQVLGDCVSYIQSLARGLRLMALDPDDQRVAGESVALVPWWSAAHRVLVSGVTPGVSVEAHLPEDLPPVLINRAGLTQAMYNLIKNASDAMADHAGLITIDAGVDPSGSMVRLRVSDDGPGMTEEVRRHCLDPFYSTKSDETTSGLGLALVQSVLKKADGSVEIQSEPGRGTTVVLLLRIAPEA
jgi:signal transduction histidine kinase